jgi:hypothetical protein
VLQNTGCDKWFQQLPKGRFRPPFSHNSDESVELFRIILNALENTDCSVTQTQLHRFYGVALESTELPFILNHNGIDETWFVSPKRDRMFRSVFLYSERLRAAVMSHNVLYPMVVVDEPNRYSMLGDLYKYGVRMLPNYTTTHRPDVDATSIRTLRSLDEIAMLIEYIQKQGKFPCLPGW